MTTPDRAYRNPTLERLRRDSSRAHALIRTRSAHFDGWVGQFLQRVHGIEAAQADLLARVEALETPQTTSEQP